jgi:glutathione S-transferase
MSVSSLPVLYSFRRCPYAIRARLALRYSGTAVLLREVVLRDKPAEMLAVSPKGTVPVLVVDTGEPDRDVLDESLEIMFWALGQNDPDGWMAVDAETAGGLIEANDDHFKPWLDRYKYPNRYDDFDPGEPLARCEKFVDSIEQRLQSQPYLCGSSASIADFALFPFIRQFAFVDIARFRSSGRPALGAWLDGMLAAPLFAEVMQKYPRWHPDDAPTLF